MKKLLKAKLALITIFLSVFCFIQPAKAQSSASLSFSPSNKSVSAGETFNTTIMVNTGGASISGVTADFTYDSSILQVNEVVSSNSVLAGLAEEDYSTAGTVYISRYVPSGNSYSGSGEVATVSFTAKANGTATLAFTDDAVVTNTASSPQNILGTSGSGTVTVGGSSLPTAGILGFENPVVLVAILAGTIFLVSGVLGVRLYFKERNENQNSFE